MSREFLGGRLVPPRRPYDTCDLNGQRRRRAKLQAGLTPSEQFKIDRGEQSAVDLRSMLDPLREVDVEAPAQRVEARRRTGKAPTRQRQCVDKLGGDWF